MAAVSELASEVGASAACQALCLPRASYYRVRRKTSFPEETVSRPLPARTLRPAERESVLACLHQERFQDRSPAAVYATSMKGNISAPSAACIVCSRNAGSPASVAIS